MGFPGRKDQAVLPTLPDAVSGTFVPEKTGRTLAGHMG